MIDMNLEEFRDNYAGTHYFHYCETRNEAEQTLIYSENNLIFYDENGNHLGDFWTHFCPLCGEEMTGSE